MLPRKGNSYDYILRASIIIVCLLGTQALNIHRPNFFSQELLPVLHRLENQGWLKHYSNITEEEMEWHGNPDLSDSAHIF